MMNARKIITLLVASCLLVACQKMRYDGEDPYVATDTYITLQIEMEGGSLRGRQPDWPAVDRIEWIYLYAFDAHDATVAGTIIPIRVPEDDQGKAKIGVTSPWRTTAGEKVFYIVANPSPDILVALARACQTSRTAFDTAYRDTAYDFLDTDDFQDFRTNYWNSERLAPTKHFINSLAQIKTDPTQDNMYYMAKYGMVQPSKALNYIKSKKSETEFNFASKIMMTGEPVTATIKAGVSEAEAPTRNNVPFTISRTVAQVVLSARGDGLLLPGFGGNNVLAPLLRYTVIYQEPTSYLLSQNDTHSGALLTPAHDNAAADRYMPPASWHNDYRQWLYVPYHTVDGDVDVNTPIEKILFSTTKVPYDGYEGNGYGECFIMGGQFLPESSQPAGRYNWTNTPIVVVQVSFMNNNSENQFGFGSVMYQGVETQKFYTRYDQAFRENNPAGTPLPSDSDTPEKQVKLRDNVITYPGARAYYLVPVNPEAGEVRRNHIYRIHNTGLTQIGYSGIPFPNSPIPCDPDDKELEPFSLSNSLRSATTSADGRIHTYEIAF